MADSIRYPRADAGLKMRKPTHRMSGTPEYRSWRSMNDRCHNTRNPAWKRYGGAGVRVCERWRSGFESFYQDMGPRPRGTSIDRVDNTKGYEPGNCRWATAQEQATNRRNTRIVEYEGKALSIAGWSRRLDVDYNKLWKLMRKHGDHRALKMSDSTEA